MLLETQVQGARFCKPSCLCCSKMVGCKWSCHKLIEPALAQQDSSAHTTAHMICFMTGDTVALEERLHSTGIVKALHSVFPPPLPDAKLSDADKAMLLPKLLSHARLHLLYVAEQLQENLAAPEAQGTTSSSKVCFLRQCTLLLAWLLKQHILAVAQNTVHGVACCAHSKR